MQIFDIQMIIISAIKGVPTAIGNYPLVIIMICLNRYRILKFDCFCMNLEFVLMGFF